LGCGERGRWTPCRARSWESPWRDASHARMGRPRNLNASSGRCVIHMSGCHTMPSAARSHTTSRPSSPVVETAETGAPGAECTSRPVMAPWCLLQARQESVVRESTQRTRRAAQQLTSRPMPSLRLLSPCLPWRRTWHAPRRRKMTSLSPYYRCSSCPEYPQSLFRDGASTEAACMHAAQTRTAARR
jgi:hypothetical protein